MNKENLNSLPVTLGSIILIAAAYFFTAQLGFLFSIPPGNVTVLWLPSGIALAALLLLDRRALIGVWLGSFAANLWQAGGGSFTFSSSPLLVSVIIALGSTLQTLAAQQLIFRWVGPLEPAFPKISIENLLKGLGAVALGCVVAATVGVTTLFLAGQVTADAYGFTWLTWWLGDVFGIVVGGPLLYLLGMFLIKNIKINMTPVLVFSFGVGLSIALFIFSWRTETNTITTGFLADAYAADTAIEQTLGYAIHDVEALQSYFNASVNVSRDEFLVFTTPHLTGTEATPGLRALSFNPYVLQTDRAAFEQQVQAAGFPDFQFTERNADGQLVRAARRPFYVVVDYIEPLEKNLPALGFDVASNPVRLEALTRARDTGEIAITAPITLVQDTEKHPGFLLFGPLYKKGAPTDTVEARQSNIEGFAVSVVQFDSLVNASVSPLPVAGRDIYLFDMDMPQGQQLLYFHPSRTRTEPAPQVDASITPESLQVDFYYSNQLDVAGRHWLVLIKPAPGLINSQRTLAPWTALILGIIISLLSVQFILIREKSTEQLQEAKEGYQRLIEQVEVAIYSADVTTTDKWEFISPRIEEMTGYTVEEWLQGGDFWLERIHPDDREAVANHDGQILGTMKRFEMDYRMITKAGNVIWVHDECVPIQDPSTGKIVMNGYFQDITLRKETERQMQELVESMPDGVLVVNDTGVITVVNKQLETLFGYDRTELMGQHIEILLPTYLREVHTEHIEGYFVHPGTRTMGADLEIVSLRKNGSEFPADISLSSVTTANGIMAIAVVRDVTEQKENEQALLERIKLQEQLEKTASVAPGLLLTAKQDANGKLSVPYTSPAIERLFGLQPQDLVESADKLFAMLDPQDAPGLLSAIEISRQTMQPLQRLLRFHHPQKGLIWVEANAAPIHETDGSTLWHGFIQNITNRKVAEEEFRLSQERFKNVFNFALDAIVTTDQTQHIILYNEAAEKMFGYPLAEVVGKKLEVLLPAEYRTAHFDFVEAYGEAGHAGTPGAARQTVTGRRANGDTFSCEVSISVITTMDGKTYTAIIRDVSERKKAEQELAEAEKQYRLLFEEAPVMNIITKFTGDDYLIVKCNPLWLSSLGYEESEVLGRPLTSFYTESSKQELKRITPNLQAGESVSAERELVTRDGRLINVLFRAVARYDENGQFLGTQSSYVDITERKLAENALIASEKLLKSLLESQSHFVVRTDLQGNHTYWNAQFEKEFAWAYSQGLANAPALMSICDYHHQRTIDVVEKCIANPGQVFAVELDKPGRDNKIITTLWDFVCLTDENNQPSEIQCMGTNITDRKNAEVDLRESNDRFSQLADNISEVFWIFDHIARKIIYLNPAYEKVWGVGAADTYRDNQLYINAVHTEDQHILFDALERQARGEMTDVEYRIVRPDGSIRWIKDRSTPIYYADGVLFRSVGVASDITVQKAAEEELESINASLEQRIEERTVEVRREESFYRTLFEDSNDAIFIHTRDMKAIRTNQRALAMLGYTPEEYEELQSSVNPSVTDPAERADAIQRFEAVLKGEKVPLYERTMIGKNGKRIPTEVNLSPVLDPEGKVIFVQSVVRDITARKQAENDLRDSRERLQYFFDTASDLIQNMDEEGRYLYVNNAWSDTLGYTWQDSQNLTVMDVIDPAFHEHCQALLASIRPETGSQNLDLIFRTKSGEAVYVEGSVTSRMSQDGHLITNGMFRDITERKVAENSLRDSLHRVNSLYTISQGAIETNQMETLVQLIADTLVQTLPADRVNVLILDVENKVVECAIKSGPGISEISDISFEEAWQGLSGWALREHKAVLSHGDVPDDRESPLVQQRKRDGNSGDIIVVPIFYKDSPLGTLTAINKPGEDNKFGPEDLELMQAVANQASMAIERMRSQFTLRFANKELERALRMKDEFLASMSHELRTPLNAIMGLSETLLEESFGPLNEKQTKYLRTVNESGNHLLALINDILDLAKIEAGELRLEIEKVHVNNIFDASVRLVKELANKKRQIITTELDPEVKYIRADERRLKQMVVNLLSNAVKFTLDEGKISIHTHADIKTSSYMITVQDSGIGIREEDLPRLFQPFVQLDGGLTRQSSGTGLGLSLVAEMARMHGGSINVESEFGAGSRFTITLPWEPDTKEKVFVEPSTSTPEEQTPSKTPQGVLNKTILVVEDTDHIGMVITDYLNHLGYKVELANNGFDAVEKTAEIQPDLILMDVQMPVMDGLEATRRIRQGISKTIPIIGLTALAMPGDRERCMNAGMVGYMSKPVRMKELAEMIKTHLDAAKKGK